MKNVLKFVFVSVFSGGIFCAPAAIYSELLTMGELANRQILKIEQTATYRCLGCYGFKVDVAKDDEVEQLKFTTRMSAGVIIVQPQ